MLDIHSAIKALAGPGADAPDARLRELIHLVDTGDAGGAAERSAVMIRAGVTDIRPLTYFAFGLFLDRGPFALAEIFDLMHAALEDHWSALRPQEKKDRLVGSALSWLFRTMIQHIEYHARMDDERFTEWRKADAPTAGGPALHAASLLRAAMASRLGVPRATDLLSELEARIRTHWNRPAAAPLRAVPPPPEPEARAPEIADRADPPPAHDPPASTGGIEVSPAMALFLRKLSAFEILLDRGELGRAALVAEDINRTLDAFDPRIFLPKLLSPYFRLLSTRSLDLAGARDAHDPGSWRALEQLFLVDLDAFLES